MNAAENYLQDMLALLIERAADARTQRDAARTDGDADRASFQGGRALAYYEVVSAMLGSLETFGLDAEKLGVRRDFNPERELL